MLAAVGAARVAAAAPPPVPRDPDPVEARLKFRACAAAHRERGVALCRDALAFGLSPARAFRAHLLLARDLGTLARWDDALESYRAALRLAPRDADAARRVGQVLLFGLGRPAEAEPYLRQALQALPSDAAAHVELARALNALGRHTEALSEFDAALALDADVLAQRPAAAAAREAARGGRVWP